MYYIHLADHMRVVCDFLNIQRNIIHGSDAVESAQREIALWFPEGLAGSGDQMGKEWIYE